MNLLDFFSAGHDDINAEPAEHLAFDCEPGAEQCDALQATGADFGANFGNYVDKRQWRHCGQFGGADMRRDGNDCGDLGAAGRQTGNEACQITCKPGAIIFFNESADPIEIGMCNKQTRHSPCRCMRGKKSSIILNGSARPEAADQAQATPCLVCVRHVSGTLPT